MPRASVINPYQKFYALDGVTPLSDGTVTFYVNGTTTLLSIYSDRALTVAQDNPYTLDAGGAITGDVFFGTTATVLSRSYSGGEVRTFDNVTCFDQATPFAPWDATITYGLEGSNIVYATDGEYYISIATGNVGNEPSVSPTKWALASTFLGGSSPSVGDNEVAVGDTILGLTGVTIDPGAVAVGSPATGIAGVAITPGEVLVGHASSAIVGISMATKGDLLAGDGTSAPQVLPVGTNTQVLIADSSQTTGLRWGASGAALAYLSTVTAAAASTVDVETGFSSTYDNYLIIGSGITLSGADIIVSRYKLGGAYITTSTYYSVADTSLNASDTAYAEVLATVIDGINFEDVHFDCNSAKKKASTVRSTGLNATPAAIQGVYGSINSGTGVKSGVRYYCFGGATITGTFKLYGIAKV